MKWWWGQRKYIERLFSDAERVLFAGRVEAGMGVRGGDEELACRLYVSWNKGRKKQYNLSVIKRIKPQLGK